MKQRTIDTSREARLWIRDIIIPAVGLITIVVADAAVGKRFKSVIDHVLNRKPGQP